MIQNKPTNIPWFLWPFARMWDLLSYILKLTGRVVGVIFGLIFMTTGIILTVTLITAPVGIPLIILGFLLLVRSVF